MYFEFLLFVSAAWSLYRWGQKIEREQDRNSLDAEAPGLV